MPEFDMEIIQKITALTERCNKAEEERDALAAHVERLFSFAASYKYDLKRTVSLHDLVDEILRKTPATSLTRLKAQWQAEALEDIAQRNSRDLIHPQTVMDEAKELHRQAEGMNDGS